MTEHINKEIAKGAAWMVFLKFSIKGISIVSTVILARLLTPDAFGLMALASSIYAMVELMRAFGFDTALIQNQNAEREHYDTAWTMQIIFSLIASATIIAVSNISAEYYGDERLAAILQMMAIVILVSGFNNIGVVEFRKKMTFKKEFLYQVLIKLSGFCVTIPLAWYWRSYWALLIGMLSGNIASLILSYTMQNYRPKITLKAWRDLLGFSSWLLFNNVLYYINNHSQNFILGKLSGSGVLGLYSISNEMATITTNQIVAPINRAAYPGYSQLAHDKTLLKQSYLKVLSHIILIAVPSAVGIAAIAPIFVPVLLGEKWLETISLIQIISLASVFISINTNSGYIYLALAKQQLTTKLLCLQLVLFLPLLYKLSSQQGAYGAALATLFSAAIMFPASLLMLKRQLGVGLFEILSILYRPCLSAIIMGGCIYQFLNNLNHPFYGVNGVLYLVTAVFVGVFTFTTCIVLIWLLTGKKEGAENWIFKQVVDKINFRKLSFYK